MFSIEEMTTWTADDAEAAVRKALPEGWTLDVKQEAGWFGAEIRNADGAEEWSDWQSDRRMLLLNAFGWITLRHQKPKHPAWRQRGSRPGPPRVSSPNEIADPPDLDPEEIRRVHAQHRDKS